MAPPTSYQESAGTLKSTKFVQTNPLDPIIRPFSDNETSTSQQEYQNEVALNVNSRLEKAMAELVIKHHGNATHNNNNNNNNNNTNVVPSNNKNNNNYNSSNISHQNNVQYSKKNDDNDNDSDYDSLLDDDNFDDDNAILQIMRERRLNEMKQQQQQTINNISKGYGQYRTIQQDEFLKECNVTNEYVVVHFYHTEFIRCKIIDYHLQIICQLYTNNCKFIRIDSTKSPFFISKLNIRTLPTIIIFYNGQVINRLIGFTGLQLITNDNNNNNSNSTTARTNSNRVDESTVENFKTDSLVQWLVSTGAIQYKAKIKYDDDEYDGNDNDNNDNNGNSSSARNRSKYSHSSHYYYDGGDE